MKRANQRRASLLALPFAFFCLIPNPTPCRGEAPAAANATFNIYATHVETRLTQQHTSAANFLQAADNTADSKTRLQRGDIILDRVPTESVPNLPGALIHHWRATAFARGATVKDFEHLARDFKNYPRYFAPDVTQSAILSTTPSSTLMSMRVRQHHVITVVLDGTYDVSFSDPDSSHGFSTSRSVRVNEIADAGTPREHPLSSQDEHGFLWRQNTYWSYEERDGGLYLQVESVSLTRAIPRGLGWAIRPYLESIPRESLEFTLRSACKAIRK